LLIKGMAMLKLIAELSLPQAEDKQMKHSGVGHRARLRGRLLKGGNIALAD
jgi:hypothetical protein